MGLISGNILDLLNQQYRHETSNSLRYYSRASWARNKGLEGAAAFLDKQAEGERTHADKVKKHIEDRNERIEIAPYDFNEDKPFNSFNSIYETALEIERETTEKLLYIYSEAMKVGDFMTTTWVQELIAEQIEEENVIQTILDRITSRGQDAASDCDNDIFVGGML